MATIAEQLTSLANTKTAIKDAIVAKGVSVADTDTFASYADKIGQIETGGGGEVVNKTKLGLTIDEFLGDVDADGVYTPPTTPLSINLSGVKSVSANSFYYAFSGEYVAELIANDVVFVDTASFQNVFYASKGDIKIRFDSLEEVTGISAFNNMCNFGSTTLDVVFSKLKRVSANNAFNNAFGNAKVIPDEVFPVLEEISGDNAFRQFRSVSSTDIIKFSALKKITGSNSAYTSPFQIFSAVVWHFPSVTEISGYVFYSSGAKEIHFAAANQAAIEACPNYDIKWGATNATIYFDL